MKIIGLAGWSGSGKTTVLTRVLPELIARGLRVSTLKHAHHRFDIDKPGKDSWQHREAGAQEVLIASANRWALMHELRGEAELSLADLLSKLSPVDLVLIEGFKASPHPKIEIHRAANGKPFLYPHDQDIRAIAADVLVHDAPVPVLELDDIHAIADMMLTQALPIDQVDERLRSERRTQ